MAEHLIATDELRRDGLLREGVHKPNLLRVATELATYKNPYRAAHTLLFLLKSSTKDSGNGNQDIGLLLGDISTIINESE